MEKIYGFIYLRGDLLLSIIFRAVPNGLEIWYLQLIWKYKIYVLPTSDSFLFECNMLFCRFNYNVETHKKNK